MTKFAMILNGLELEKVQIAVPPGALLTATPKFQVYSQRARS
jgi:hypothetical protein